MQSGTSPGSELKYRLSWQRHGMAEDRFNWRSRALAQTASFGLIAAGAAVSIFVHRGWIGLLAIVAIVLGLIGNRVFRRR